MTRTEVCYVCDREYLASEARLVEHDTHGLSVCPWCAIRGWPLVRRLRETLADIGSRSCECSVLARDALSKPEGAKTQSATGLLGDEAYVTKRKAVRRVRKRR